MKQEILLAVVSLAFFVLLRCLLVCSISLNIGFAIVSLALADLVTRAIIHLFPKELIDPSDKAVFITGCDTGFGHQLAKRLDNLGFHVYACCLFPEQDGARKLKETCSERLKIIPLDVTSDDQVETAVQDVTSSLEGKKLWAIVNNAGIATYSELEWTPLAICKQTLEVNTIAVLRVTQAFLPLLRKTKGRVVIVASMAGRISLPGLGTYAMSKYAAVALADTLRCEMQKWGISVHTIEPMLYKTPIASVEQNLKNTKKAWEACPKEIQEDYGQEYIRAFLTQLTKLIGMWSNENIEHVTDAMIDAVHNKDPQIRYVPSLVAQFQDRALTLMPTKLQHFLFNLLLKPRCSPAAIKKLHSS